MLCRILRRIPLLCCAEYCLVSRRVSPVISGGTEVCVFRSRQGHQLYGGTEGLCWIDNYSTTRIYKYLLMSRFVVQSDK